MLFEESPLPLLEVTGKPSAGWGKAAVVRKEVGVVRGARTAPRTSNLDHWVAVAG